ncbi:MAG: right-handed parallel beta-helix repeat-containing protein [Bryobacterales bacterium]|nr:right-handed parallel beta-helix repeat-containing protein [Bryobacterales bacterium]
MLWSRFPFLALFVAIASAGDYYVDCRDGNDAANGLSPATALRSVTAANRGAQPGPADRVLLKRGTVCMGVLAPQGSGTAGQPNAIDSYGEGPLPVVNAAGGFVAIRLNNQEYWRISRVAATGSTEHGIFIGASNRVVHDIQLRDVQVWGVHGKLTTKTSGLIVASATGTGLFDGLVIDGATVWDTTQWSGIQVNGAPWSTPLADRRSTGVVIRNSIAHGIWGDGIVLFQVAGGLIERSAAWNTGMQPTQTIGTPSGIWTWRCKGCQVRECESYFADSPGVDGGSFDVDWGNDDNVFEQNYGHDSQAYCISVFGAENLTTTNSVIRDNLCVGNNRSPRLARHHGGIHLVTWNGGKLDGVSITGNVVVWTPPVNAPLIRNEASFTGTRPNTVENNVFIASMPELLRSNGALRFRANRYQVWHGTPEWTDSGMRFVGLDTWRAHGQDNASTMETSLPDPLGGPFEVTGIPARLRNAGIGIEALQGRFALVGLLSGDADARALAVHLSSARFQYAAKGLQVVAAIPGTAEQRRNTAADWGLDAIEIVALPAATESELSYRNRVPLPKRPRPIFAAGESPAVYLLDPQGRLLRSWHGYRPAKEILAALRAAMGSPAGMNASVASPPLP